MGGKFQKTMMEGKNLMKNTTLMMYFIAALAIFTLPVVWVSRVRHQMSPHFPNEKKSGSNL